MRETGEPLARSHDGGQQGGKVLPSNRQTVTNTDIDMFMYSLVHYTNKCYWTLVALLISVKRALRHLMVDLNEYNELRTIVT